MCWIVVLVIATMYSVGREDIKRSSVMTACVREQIADPHCFLSFFRSSRSMPDVLHVFSCPSSPTKVLSILLVASKPLFILSEHSALYSSVNFASSPREHHQS